MTTFPWKLFVCTIINYHKVSYRNGNIILLRKDKIVDEVQYRNLDGVLIIIPLPLVIKTLDKVFLLNIFTAIEIVN